MLSYNLTICTFSYQAKPNEKMSRKETCCCEFSNDYHRSYAIANHKNTENSVNQSKLKPNACS